MATYMLDKETRELIPKYEWVEKYGEPTRPRGPMIINKSFEAYESPITGEIITTHRQRTAEMKEHGCVDYEPSLKEEINRNLKRSEEALEKAVDETVDQAISEMTPRQQEQLDSELMAGADIEYKRVGDD